jgi:transposase
MTTSTPPATRQPIPQPLVESRAPNATSSVPMIEATALNNESRDLLSRYQRYAFSDASLTVMAPFRRAAHLYDLVSVSELILVGVSSVATEGTPGRSDGVESPFHQEFRCYPAPAWQAPPHQRWRRLAPFHRGQPARSRRYPSDTTDAQWAVLDPLLPDPAWLAGRGGRPEAHCRRQIVDAIFYLVDNGIKWRALPTDFPPWPTVYKHLAAWEAAGVTQQVLDGLRDRVRLREGPRSRAFGRDHRFPVGTRRPDRAQDQPRL